MRVLLRIDHDRGFGAELHEVSVAARPGSAGPGDARVQVAPIDQVVGHEHAVAEREHGRHDRLVATGLIVDA